MPLFSSFSAASSRSLGLTSGAPPGAPVIDSSSSTATTLTINFTPVVGSFPISKFEYSLNSGAFTGNIAGNAVQFEITGLIPSTSYSVRIRATDEAGQISDPSNTETRSTTAEIAPSAPSVTVTQKESGSGTPTNATKLDVSFTAAPAGTYPVAYHQYQVYRGATLVSDWATTPVGAGVTFTIEGLVPASSHTVNVRGVATTNGTTLGATGSGSATTDTEIVNSAPTVTINSVTTTNVTFTRGTSSGGTYGVEKYRYRIRNSGGTVVAGPTDLTSGTSHTVAAGVSPNETFTVDVFAISLTSGASGTIGSANGQLNPLTPSTPTATWSGMTTSTHTTATMTISKPSYATRAFVQLNGGTTYDSVTNSGLFVLNGGGTAWTFTLTGVAHNTSNTFRVYVQNRIGGQSGDAYRYWDTPKKNQPWNSGYIQTSAIYFSTTAACTSEFRYVFGVVPSSDNEVGYIAVNSLYVEGIQQTGTNLNGCTGASQTLANTGSGNIFWQSDSAHPDFTGGFGFTLTTGFSPNWGTGTFSSRSVSLTTWGGSNISGKYFSIGSQVGSRTGGCAVGCSLSGSTLNAYRMRNFLISGVQTTAGNPY